MIIITTILIIGGDSCCGNYGQTVRAKFKILMIFFLLGIELLLIRCQHLNYDSIGNILRILPGKDIG